jgi:hypothetical protein
MIRLPINGRESKALQFNMLKAAWDFTLAVAYVAEVIVMERLQSRAVVETGGRNYQGGPDADVSPSAQAGI